MAASTSPLPHWSMLVVIATMLYTTQARLVDLSHDHDKDTLMSPNNPKYKRDPIFEGALHKGVYAKFNNYSIGEHGGTHLDAPTHFHPGGHSLDKIPLEDTIADGVMIDCRLCNSVLTLDKLKKWEDKYGKIPQRAAVVVYYDWSKHYKDINKYYGTNNLRDQLSYRFPIVSEDAIEFLVTERDIKILAIDGPSPDILDSKFPVHVKMLKANKLIVENVKDPSRLPRKGFRFFATPVKFVGATGVQVRAFAIVDEDHHGSGSDRIGVGCFVLAVVAMMNFFSKLI